MKGGPYILFTIILAPLAFAPAARGQAIKSIVNSKHNLSASGPGAIRATSEQEVCIFCHTAHNAGTEQPLWNRNTPVGPYTVYSSTSLQAKPGQPTGTSKLCLSCHDGTIAIGSVISRDQPIAMAGGVTTLPPGTTNIGTDLSDDHPISFRYDADLATRVPKLQQPSSLPLAIKLDTNREMQCTSCHDPHNDANGKFLVMDNSNSQLCNACHRQGTTNVQAHSQCAACHTPHSAPSKALLLVQQTVTDTCLGCHGGQPPPVQPGTVGGTPAAVTFVQGSNVAADLNKLSTHDTRSPVDQKDHVPNNVTCNDCHEPHTMLTGIATAPLIQPRLGAVDGVNTSGAVVTRAQFEYEVCFKCHADRPAQVPSQPRVARQVVQVNTRLQFAPSAVSYHPVEAAGRNPNAPSLRPGLTTASQIYCSDCHSSDVGKVAGGTGPSGTHGSNSPPLLALPYETTDNTTESATAYALCYSCHDRSSILADQSFKTHKLHVVDQRTPCSVCHESHGISSTQGSIQRNSALINFDTSVVRPDPVTGKLEALSTGMGQGTCALLCHDVPHSPLPYDPGAAGVMNPAFRRGRGIAPAPLVPRGPAPRAPGRTR